MTPVEAIRKKNESTMYFNLYGDMEQLSSKPRFKVGDKVRISKYKWKVLDKGYTANWSEEIFLIDKSNLQTQSPTDERISTTRKYKAAFVSLNYCRQNKIYSALKKSFGGIIKRNKLW